MGAILNDKDCEKPQQLSELRVVQDVSNVGSCVAARDTLVIYKMQARSLLYPANTAAHLGAAGAHRQWIEP
jgi:hypothetical protein